MDCSPGWGLDFCDLLRDEWYHGQLEEAQGSVIQGRAGQCFQPGSVALCRCFRAQKCGCGAVALFWCICPFREADRDAAGPVLGG